MTILGKKLIVNHKNQKHKKIVNEKRDINKIVNKKKTKKIRKTEIRNTNKISNRKKQIKKIRNKKEFKMKKVTKTKFKITKNANQ